MDPELLKRYADGHCSPEERARVEQWLNQDEGNEEPLLLSGIDKGQLKQAIWNEVNPAEMPEKGGGRLLNYFYKVATCLILFGAAGFLIYRFNRPVPSAQLAALTPNYTELNVPKGKKAQLTLTDGTVVYLNGDTRLKYPAEFTGPTRVIYLSGEAHFKVAKDPAKPFVIHTAKTNTRVLGTVFNIKAYPDELNTTLTVEEGRVQFSLADNKAKMLILTAGFQGIAGNGQTLKLQQVYAANYTAWKNEKLIFSNLTLKEIAALLNRWYNVPVAIDNHKLEKERFTGTYQQAPVRTVAQDISQAFHCRFKLSDQNLLFY